MFPLLQFTSSQKRMGRFVNGRFLLVAGWTSCLFITVMDIISLPQVLGQAWAVIAGTCATQLDVYQALFFKNFCLFQ